MFTFTTQEYADIHYIYGFCDGNSAAAAREYALRFPNRRIPDRRVFQGVHNHLREYGTFPKSSTERPIQQTVENEENILRQIDNNPSTSVRKISAQVNASRMRVWRTLKRHSLYPFHIQPVQALLPTDFPKRMEFCRWIINNRQIINKILFTDESTFTRNGLMNRRNSHFWNFENPYETTQSNHQSRFSVNVWCGIIDNILIGPFVFENHLTADRYLDFLENHLVDLLENVPLTIRQGMWYQHDGAPAHFPLRVRQFLDQRFEGRVIGRGAQHSWPPRSPDLTCLDYYLWGHMKDMVYQTPSETVEDLRRRIFEVADLIRNNNDMLHRATRALLRRARLCLARNGGHFEAIL